MLSTSYTSTTIEITTNHSKFCPACNRYHPIADFGSNRGLKDGYNRICRTRHAAQAKQYRADHPGYQSRISATYLSNDEGRMKHAARGIHNAAIRSGKITRPSICPLCGRSHRCEAHHTDYTRPLHVYYACPACHGALDKMTEDQVIALYTRKAPGYLTPEQTLATRTAAAESILLERIFAKAA